MKVKGILRGQTIELLEQVNAPDGTEVTVEVKVSTNQTSSSVLSDEERLAKLNQLFGVWKNQRDLDEIFAEIDRERHIYQGRRIEFLDG